MPATSCIFGGDATDYATKKRIEGFRSVELTYRDRIDNDQIISCGYSPARAAREIEALCDRLGGLPSGLLVNSLTAFEGVMSHFVRLPPDAFNHSVVGCYDYDPFAAYLRIPVHMVRQNSHGLISRAYDLVDGGETRPIIVEVDAELIPPQTIYKIRCPKPADAAVRLVRAWRPGRFVQAAEGRIAARVHRRVGRVRERWCGRPDSIGQSHRGRHRRRRRRRGKHPRTRLRRSARRHSGAIAQHRGRLRPHRVLDAAADGEQTIRWPADIAVGVDDVVRAAGNSLKQGSVDVAAAMK